MLMRCTIFIGDFAFIIAIGSNAKCLDNVTADIARTKKHILICFDNDEGGLVALNKWRKNFFLVLSLAQRPYSKI